MKSVSIDMMSLLQTNGFGTIGTDLFAMAWGDGVDAQILILDTDGIRSTLKVEYENPTFQILVRGARNADMDTTYQLARSIYEFLIIRVREIIDTTEYLEYEPTSSIIGLSRDENDRAVFSMNFYTFRIPFVGAL